ncbi:aquaporin-1 isoform X1 [Pteropus vampyrus]|uniref:Aquaporin-1 n=1 Tax=Pteropus vampyrus TaxID=132908 RepID=A0A6P6CKG7_PTEVA|nr:aquaporin-1 isoform X1 [Pteropus vampyrus]
MASEFKKKLFWRAVVAEFLAMTLFVFISIGSALGFNYPLKNNQTSGATQDNVKVSLAFGLSIATLAQSVGHISGAHLNPAVTLGLLLSCQISILRAVMYIIAQCVGAIVATAILSGITSSLSNNSLGRNEILQTLIYEDTWRYTKPWVPRVTCTHECPWRSDACVWVCEATMEGFLVVVMGFGRGRSPTHVVLDSQVFRALDSQEGTSWRSQGRWPVPVDSESLTWHQHPPPPPPPPTHPAHFA